MIRSSCLLLLTVQLFVVSGCVAHPDRQAVSTTGPVDPYSTFVAAARHAEAIDDPLQRCLSYPELPGSHWDKKTTAAYCRLQGYHTLQLPEIAALVKQGRAAEVDRTFQEYLDAQRHDPKKVAMLDVAFIGAGFRIAGESARTVIDQWMKQAPNSAFALAASGMQHVSAAWEARGNAYARNLTEAQIGGMRREIALARKDLDRAVELQPQLTTAYAEMIEVGATQGDEAYMDRAAQLGLAIDPANLKIRQEMMGKAQQKWGESFGGEDKQVSEVLALVPKNPLLLLVAAQPVMRRVCNCDGITPTTEQLSSAADKGVFASDLIDLGKSAHDLGDRQLAVEFYSGALRFHPKDPTALERRSEALMEVGNLEWSIDSIRLAAARSPGSSEIALALARIYQRAGKLDEAENTYQAVIDRDPSQISAMTDLGQLYATFAQKPDKAMALAQTMIDRHPNDPGGYLVRASAQLNNELPGRYETIQYFLDHFGNQPDQRPAVDMLRSYLADHPENKR
jgi:tetratricopeptide (TPR) repeat protein